MNHLFIIGNGFDLAHGLKTRYLDFILWYLKKRCTVVIENFSNGLRVDNDGLIRIAFSPMPLMFDNIESLNSIRKNIEEFDSVEDYQVLINNIKGYYSSNNKSFSFEESTLLKSILEENGWANIERIYYKMLVSTVDIHTLNGSFAKLKSELELYLVEQVEPAISNDKKKDHFKNLLFYKLKGNTFGFLKGKVLYLNFNYTNTFEKLYFSKQNRGKNIYIHGKCYEKENPIIFGYGDEMDDHFVTIEKKEENAFLDNMKSFGYFQTDNYKKVLAFIKSGEFRTHLIGHSLGLSDRLLLNTVFENENCKEIEIHYSRKLNNYYELAKNMSRHFNLAMKGSMREKVIPYLDTNSIE